MKPSSKAACLSAFVFPGAGQVYLKHYFIGSIFIVIAGIALYMILSAAFDVAFAIVDQIQAGNVGADTLSITALVSQAMDVFNQANLIAAKIAAMVSWIISTIHAWLAGKKLDQK